MPFFFEAVIVCGRYGIFHLKKPLSRVLHGIEIRPVAAVAGTETNCLRPALQVALVMQ